MSAHVCTKHPAPARACYVTCKCRCARCRDANRRYMADLTRRRLAVAWGAREADFVDADMVADLIRALQDAGMGLRTIAERAGVSRSGLSRIVNGTRGRVTRSTFERLSTVRPAHVADGARVDASATHRLVAALLDGGWTAAAVGAWVTGNPDCKSLQVGDRAVTAGTARQVLQLHRCWSDGHIQTNERPEA